jgi:hypothetical protein
MYKICEIHGEHDFNRFDLLTSHDKLLMQDDNWHTICDTFNWQYIPTFMWIISISKEWSRQKRIGACRILGRLKLTHERLCCIIHRAYIFELNDFITRCGWSERQVSYTDVRSDLHLSVLWEETPCRWYVTVPFVRCKRPLERDVPRDVDVPRTSEAIVTSTHAWWDNKLNTP